MAYQNPSKHVSWISHSFTVIQLSKMLHSSHIITVCIVCKSTTWNIQCQTCAQWRIALCVIYWPQVIHTFCTERYVSMNWQSRHSLETLLVKIQDTYTHPHTLHILTIRKQMYTTICTHAWQSDRALSVWWQYRILAWLRWRRQRQEWNCQQLGVTGSWDGEDGKRDSKVDGTQSLCPSVYLTLPRPCASLFHPPLFSFVLSYHSF